MITKIAQFNYMTINAIINKSASALFDSLAKIIDTLARKRFLETSTAWAIGGAVLGTILGGIVGRREGDEMMRRDRSSGIVVVFLQIGLLIGGGALGGAMGGISGGIKAILFHP